MHQIDFLRLSAIVESSDDAIISKTLQGVITSWNKSAERLFGYEEAEVVGKHISIIIPHERLQEEDIIINKIRNGEKVDHFETIRLSKSGQEFPISLTISPIRDFSGNIIGASKIARDITEQIEVRNKIRLYHEQLEKASQYKDEFIGIASHELKTPLTSIFGYLQLLERMQQDEKSKEFARKTIKQVVKLDKLISNLLDVSKVQLGKLELTYAPFLLQDFLLEAIDIAAQISLSHKIELKLDTEDIVIYGDRQRLEQVMINLLSNAVKYSPSKDLVIVTASVDGNMLKINIRDFGIGIPKNQQDKVFSRFYRVERGESVYSGLGIGLFISNEIVKMHKGEIWIDDTEPIGSIFNFSIPI